MDEVTRQPGTASEPAEPALGSANDLDPLEVGSLEMAPAAPARKRSMWLIGGLGLLVIVLAAAAYVGGRLLNRAPGGQAGGRLMLGKGGSVVSRVSIEPAKELPQSTPDLRGVMVRRQDNSLFVGTGIVMRDVQKGSSGTPALAITHDGPVLEAVVTHDTQIYRDETNVAASPSDSDTIQQVVKPGSLDEITANSMIQVWGVKTGDRTVARILVYRVDRQTVGPEPPGDKSGQPQRVVGG